MSQKTEIKSTTEPQVLDTYSSAYAPAGANLRWTKVYISYTDLAAAATTSEYIIAVPDNCVFIHCIAEVTQVFDVITQFSVGDTVNSQSAISLGIDLSEVRVVPVTTASTYYRSGQDIKVFATGSANLDTATTGNATLNFLYATVP